MHEAPAPGLARFEAAHHRVPASSWKCCGGVLALRGVAAPDIAAGQAQPQVHPFGALAQAVDAALRAVRRRRSSGARTRSIAGAGRLFGGDQGLSVRGLGSGLPGGRSSTPRRRARPSPRRARRCRAHPCPGSAAPRRVRPAASPSAAGGTARSASRRRRRCGPTVPRLRSAGPRPRSRRIADDLLVVVRGRRSGRARPGRPRPPPSAPSPRPARPPGRPGPRSAAGGPARAATIPAAAGFRRSPQRPRGPGSRRSARSPAGRTPRPG